ncbi:N-acetylmuramoyl-L-alanine amidase [Steroidobacter agaridevorans]|uniref:N-acetylmuramoyl-L-alanine amidase AmiC n=1 Tax=Steroidobacter agaridevorans TaxID=2695856 RepID=A0A829YM27_9GAMM|nr:N-acetylmuramoyl-L-alanine amidase [Steroidobacter agaridevorans]GFE90893.1 N-acetylmuramoyl-L-alanine amidase [Steroidobacter agaridevorans]
MLSVLAGCLGLALAAVGASAAKPVTVKDVRLWAGPDGTRLVFDLSEPAEHNVLTLDNPDRVVVDIPAATLESERVLPEGQGFVKQLRAAAQPNGDLRVVVDLTGPAEPKTFTVGPQQSYGHRLVLDLTPGKGTVAAAPSQPSVVKAAADAHGRDIVIAIDAGHGGVDPGSIGKRGTYEKHVTLAIAKRLKDRIDREPGMRAILTRDNDTFVEHRERIARARRQQADMFVSVHADSYTNRSVAGSSVYVLSARGASDESARWLADRENAADLIGGVKLDDKDSVLASVLLDLSQGASMSASVDAAELVMQELYKIGNITNRGVKHAGFLVLKSPDIPSMLVETAFISNPTEEARLLDPKHQQRLAEAIHQGVREYFYTNPPPGTLVADLRAKQSGTTVIASTTDGESAGSTAR